MDKTIKQIHRDEVIGHIVLCVRHIDIANDNNSNFKERKILIQLDNNIQFLLQQDFDYSLGYITMYRYNGINVGDIVINYASDCRLGSTVVKIVRPYGWKYSIGLVLDNGFILHDAFSSWDNGVIFYKISEKNDGDFVDVQLPL